MSQDDLSPAAPPVAPATPSTRARAPRRSGGGGTTALALLLALIAIGGAGYVGWCQYQQMQAEQARAQRDAALQQQVDGLQHALSGTTGQGNTLAQRLNDADQVNRGLREQVLSQDQRLRDLEGAVGRLSEKTLSGQDAMRLDDTDSLLRMGAERYVLFHDANGAAQAYALAASSLAGVNDENYNGVREGIAAEREALSKSVAAGAPAALDTLTALRSDAPNWPLKPLDQVADDGQTGFWARLRRALGSVITISHDNGGEAGAIADARLVRALTALDLAQAQTELLNWNVPSAVAALRHADAGLAAQFDPAAAPVQQARAQLAALIKQLDQPQTPVKLGAALNDLRSVRAVHALAPAPAGTVAAPAGATP